MGEDHERLGLSQFRQEAFLVGKRLQGIKIKAGHPGIGKMGIRGHEIRGKVRRIAFRFHPHALHTSGVPRANLHPHARNDFRVPIQKLRLRLRGGEKMLHIAGAIALRGMVRIFPFAALHEISRAREGRHKLSVLAPNIPPAMVEVQVRIDDDVDILGFQLQLLEFTGESPGVIHTINLIIFCVEFISDAGLHQNVMAARLDQQASQAKANAIAGVGGDSLSPTAPWEQSRTSARHRAGNFRRK